LALTPVAILGALWADIPQADIAVALGLLVFGFAFAVNSSLHSYLVLAYAGSEKAAEDVGFYYAANAAGRFMGTALSGLLYQWGGLELCLAAATALLTICWITSLRFPETNSS
jgi:predicted MFS family arabinose efflux permease